jgi:hypothetical protein
VLLSRRVSVLLGALVLVVMALGIIMGVLRAVSASPETTDKKHGNTLTVLTKTREEKVVDLGPRGPTHGDMSIPLRRSWSYRGGAMLNFAFWGFSEVRISPAQSLWASLAAIGCLRVLSLLPHNTHRTRLPHGGSWQSDRGSQRLRTASRGGTMGR